MLNHAKFDKIHKWPNVQCDHKLEAFIKVTTWGGA